MCLIRYIPHNNNIISKKNLTCFELHNKLKIKKIIDPTIKDA